MTIEQAKALIPNKDYVVFNQNIYKFLFLEEKNFGSLSIEFIYLEINNEPVKVPPLLCITLGEYRGSFNSSVLPPKVEGENYSVEVFVLTEYGSLDVAFYDYIKNDWAISPIDTAFNWCFKPDYLSYIQ